MIPAGRQPPGSHVGARRWARWLGAAGLALAGGAHVAVAIEHDAAGHGMLFLLTGTSQLGLAGMVARRSTRWALWAAVLSSVLLTVAWSVTRSPTAAAPTPAGLLDLSAVTGQLVTIAASAVLLRRRHRLPNRVRPVLVAAAAVAGLTAGSLTPDSHDHHHREPPAADAAPPVESEIFGDLFADHHAVQQTEPSAEHSHDHGEPDDARS